MLASTACSCATAQHALLPWRFAHNISSCCLSHLLLSSCKAEAPTKLVLVFKTSLIKISPESNYTAQEPLTWLALDWQWAQKAMLIHTCWRLTIYAANFKQVIFFFTLFTVSPRSIRKKKEGEKKLAKSHIYISKCHHFQEPYLILRQSTKTPRKQATTMNWEKLKYLPLNLFRSN